MSLSACGTSNKSSPTSTSTSTSTVTSTSTSAAPNAEAKVSGLIASVAGNSIQVTKEDNGTAAVNFTSTTKITEAVPAGLSDVTPGSCVNVRATPQSGPPPDAITAQSVTVTPAADGKCPPPAGFFGTVASVDGNTIAVTGLGPGGPTNVTVADSTSYQRQTPSDAQAITNGKCLGPM